MFEYSDDELKFELEGPREYEAALLLRKHEEGKAKANMWKFPAYFHHSEQLRTHTYWVVGSMVAVHFTITRSYLNECWNRLEFFVLLILMVPYMSHKFLYVVELWSAQQLISKEWRDLVLSKHVNVKEDLMKVVYEKGFIFFILNGIICFFIISILEVCNNNLFILHFMVGGAATTLA